MSDQRCGRRAVRQRLGPRGEQPEPAGEVRHLEQPANGSVGGDDDQAVAALLELAGGLEDRAERSRIDEVDGDEVEDDALAGPVPRHGEDGGQARRGGDVELAGGRHEVATVDGIVVDREVHGRRLPTPGYRGSNRGAPVPMILLMSDPRAASRSEDLRALAAAARATS